MSIKEIRTRLGGRIAAKLYSLTDITGYTFPVSGWWPGSIEPDLLAERLEKGFDWTSVRVWQEMSRWAVEGRFDYEEAWAETALPRHVAPGVTTLELDDEAWRAACNSFALSVLQQHAAELDAAEVMRVLPGHLSVAALLPVLGAMLAESTHRRHEAHRVEARGPGAAVSTLAARRIAVALANWLRAGVPEASR